MLPNRGKELCGRHVEGFGVTQRIADSRDQFAKQRPALFERPRSQIGAGKNEKVKSIEQDRVLGAAEILEQVERRHPILGHGNDLAVDDRFVRKTMEGSGDGREPFAEILSVAGCEMRTAVALDPDPAR
jgi:hypothetical protein